MTIKTANTLTVGYIIFHKNVNRNLVTGYSVVKNGWLVLNSWIIDRKDYLISDSH